MSKQKNIKLYNLEEHNNALKKWFSLYTLSVTLHDLIDTSKWFLSIIQSNLLTANTFERLLFSNIDIAKSRDTIEDVIRCLIGSLDYLPYLKYEYEYAWRRSLEVIYWTGLHHAYNVPISESIACLYDPGAKTEEECSKFVSQVVLMNKKLDTLSMIKDIQATAAKILKAHNELFDALLENREKIYKK